ncbi:unnamed protein product [Prorocentrum cordatum]|uniref:Subtilisin n=1 Tax=Prorocentrum cordatum TaxID=2364126 RepID=A0ABN9WTB9_9DINO|nr:unnamed protein product [Polarella glacialis]
MSTATTSTTTTAASTSESATFVTTASTSESTGTATSTSAASTTATITSISQTTGTATSTTATSTSDTSISKTSTTATSTSTTTPLYVVISAMSFQSNGTAGNISSALTSLLASLYNVDEENVLVSVEYSPARYAVDGIGTEYDVGYEIIRGRRISPMAPAEVIYSHAVQVANDTASAYDFGSAVQVAFLSQGFAIVGQ